MVAALERRAVDRVVDRAAQDLVVAACRGQHTGLAGEHKVVVAALVAAVVAAQQAALDSRKAELVVECHTRGRSVLPRGFCFHS